jgi:signal transduction histidine kinase
LSVKVPNRQFEDAWNAWLVDRNHSGGTVALGLVALFHPLFAALDWYTAQPDILPVLLLNRVVGLGLTMALWLSMRTVLFRTRSTELTSFYIVLVCAGLTVMTSALGGFSSAYYQGINLVMLGVGLLFVWPRNWVLFTHGAIVTTYFITNALTHPHQMNATALPPLFFMGATAFTVSAGQIFGYFRHRDQVRNRLALEFASQQITDANDELKRIDQFKSRFFANITHELKTPLAMVLSPVELLIEGELGHLTDPQRSTLRSVHRNGLRLLRLIGDLLDLSRLEESRLRLRVGEHDLVAYLRQLVAQIDPLTSRKNIDITFTSEHSTAPTWCDIDRMERVFVNLLSNAAKFTPAGGHIAVSVVATTDKIMVSVRDDGPGFSPNVAAQVFERFFQVAEGDANVQNKGGTGIGLALARELVELHGGKIWAESDIGKGANFFVEMPRDRGHFRDEVVAAEIVEASPPTATIGTLIKQGWTEDIAGRDDFRFMDVAQATERRVVERDLDERSRGRTILVIDDTPDVIRLVHLILRQQFRIFAAPDGVRGLELALREVPGLIITDLMMPEMDGYELTRKLRADDRTKHIPVVMLTARGETEDKVKGLESGVNAYLTKPFSARELMVTVRKLLAEVDSATSMMLTHRMDSMEIVAGGLAHEINNPLNYIKNSMLRVRKDVDEFLALIAKGQLTPEKTRSLETRMALMFKTAESGVVRIGDTVALMGRYSREGYSRIHRPYDLFAATLDVVDLVLPATGRRVKVTKGFEGDGTVECVPEEANQLLTNLIQNAIEAAPDDDTGVVEIIGEATDAMVILSIRDNGLGVKPEDHGKIFTPFFTTKAPGAGMGMGLTLAWRVTQTMGGTLSEEGQYGTGACFVVRIPKPVLSQVVPTPKIAVLH